MQQTTTYNYPVSLMYLMHSVIHSDGEAHDKEVTMAERIFDHEDVPVAVKDKFHQDLKTMDAKNMYAKGLDALKLCSREEQNRTLAWIHSVMEADSHVDVKEARFLLYAMNATNVQFEEILELSNNLPKV